ncbi:MAG TPA: fibronectin type III domain-containing protein, partial [Longimicrobiales bacterium]|nr:fibronectin type III domain-containing protein [Longimicrobiales bacterium]
MLRKSPWFLALALTAVVGACGDDDDSGTNVTLPPATPTGVAAAVAAGGVNVTWNTVTGATAYDVQRQALGAGSFSTIGGDVTGTNYTDAGVAPGTYLYRVIAKNSGGSSSASDPATAVIEAEMPFATLSGTITGERTLSADTTYTLQGIVVVDDGGRLNIPAGTLLYGSTAIQPTALIVRQGGLLYSEGTETAPVVFTSP